MLGRHVFAGHLTPIRACAILESLPHEAVGQLICHPGDSNRNLRSVYPWRYDWETGFRLFSR